MTTDRFNGPVAPFVVVDGFDVSAYATVEQMALHLEAQDVQENAYIAFDAEGRLLRLGVEHNQVTVECTEDVPTHAEQLAHYLRQSLQAAGRSEISLKDWNLAQLVQACPMVSSESLGRIIARWLRLIPK